MFICLKIVKTRWKRRNADFKTCHAGRSTHLKKAEMSVLGLDGAIRDVLRYKMSVKNAKRHSGIWNGHLTYAPVVNKYKTCKQVLNRTFGLID